MTTKNNTKFSLFIEGNRWDVTEGCTVYVAKGYDPKAAYHLNNELYHQLMIIMGLPTDLETKTLASTSAWSQPSEKDLANMAKVRAFIQLATCHDW